jgi:hypothetical protein
MNGAENRASAHPRSHAPQGSSNIVPIAPAVRAAYPIGDEIAHALSADTLAR